MENPEIQHLLSDLEYGIIYVCGNPKQTHNLRWFASVIEPRIRPMSIKWVQTWDIHYTLLVARRFNVGNMGKYATVQLHMNEYGHSSTFSVLAAFHAFNDCLSDVMDDGQGDVIINEREFSDRNETPHGTWGSSSASTPFSEILMEDDYMLSCPQDHTRVEATPPPDLEKTHPVLKSKKEKHQFHEKRRSLRDLFRKKESSIGNRDSAEDEVLMSSDANYDAAIEDICSIDFGSASPAESPVVQDLEVEEVKEFRRIESEYERDVNDLRARIVAFIAKYHQDPQQMMSTLLEGKVLIGQSPGHLLVNGDMKIVLPEYDEMEIKMPAMSRTLYILFMKLRKQGTGGIVLKNIDEHRNNIIDIYSMVKPGADEDRVIRSVDNLCDPYGESLNQAISRINRCIKSVIIDKQLCQQYLISGKKGGEYSIALDPELLQLPRAVTEA